MNRRDFLAFQKVREKRAAERPSKFLKDQPVSESTMTAPAVPMRPPVLVGLEPYTGTWGVAQAAHLLRRTTFGAKYPDVKRMSNMTMEQCVSEILTPFSAPFGEPVNDYNDGDTTDPTVPFGESIINAEWDDTIEGTRIWSFKNWWLRKMINQDTTIGEKLLLFWHNHIPVQFFDVFWVTWNYNYLKTLRDYSFGNFKSMVRAITIETAMLMYLNGQQNHKDEPDENYARELQELFCIGKGPNAKFNEEDVQAMARVLTGWRYNWNNEEVEFARWAHDTNDKQLSAFYNNAVITGRTGDAGAEELDDLMDVIFDNNEVALFLCRKLYRFFVYHDIDATTEREVIEPLADIFRENNYEIMPVLDKLFRSQHFFDALNQGAMLKSGVDFQVSMYREFNVELPPASALYDRYQITGTMMYYLELFQQSIGDPPNVSGWAAYYQIPQFDKHWITTDTLPKRIQVADYMLAVGIESDNYAFPLDVISVTKQFDNPDDPRELIDKVTEWLFGIEISAGVKLVLRSILLSGQLQDYYWSNAWNEYIQNPNDPMAEETVRTRLQGMYYYLIHLEEFQLV